MPRRVAVTGASGFLGRRLITRLVQDGRRVSALLRRPDPVLSALGVEAVAGSLAEPVSLVALVRGADAVIHVAGAIRAKGPAEFHAVNAAGTAALAEALLQQLEPPRLVHVSSLAARAPQVSAYAASKRAAEDELTRRSPPLRHVVVRPPAIYGPGDRATLPIFQQLSRGWLVAPRAASNRFSLVHVDDLVELLVTLLATDLPAGTVLEPDAGTLDGYGWADLARIAG